MKRIAVGLALSGLLSGCSGQNALSSTVKPYEYALTEDGPAETQQSAKYESLGDMTFTRMQKYKLVARSDAARAPHFLVLSVTQTVGKKIIQRDQVAPIFMQDGSYTLECSHFYDIKISAGEDSVDDPRCSVKLLGVLTPDATAKLVK